MGNVLIQSKILLLPGKNNYTQKMDSYKLSEIEKLSPPYIIHNCLKQFNKVLFQLIVIYKVVNFSLSFVYNPFHTFYGNLLQTV